MPKRLESGVHSCYVCNELLVKPDKVSHMNNPDGSISFRHLWHGSTNLLKETSHTHYAMSFKAAHERAMELLAREDISEQTRKEEELILQELNRLRKEDALILQELGRLENDL